MYYLIEFLRKYHYLLLFVVLEVVSFVLLCRFNSYQGSVALSAANGTAAAIGGLYDEAKAYIQLGEVNADLTQRNLQLQMQNEQLRERLRQFGADSSYTAREVARVLETYTLIPATVVSNSVSSRRGGYLVIDKGAADGVRPEMGVVGGGGVVGIVYLVEQNHALIIPLTNAMSNVSCRVRGENYFGYLSWQGGSLLHATLQDIPRYAGIKPGGVVETSGYSSVFPPGIFVGRIKAVNNSADGQSYAPDVNLGTDFARIRDVAVVATPYKAEIDSLYHHAHEAEAQMSRH